MRLRSLLFLGLAAGLAACAKTNQPVRLDFIGNTALTSGPRLVSAGDTLATRAYAVGNDNPLTRLRITVTYQPTRNPLLYPIPLSGYQPGTTPNDPELVYLDSLVTPVYTGLVGAPRGGEVLFQNRFVARTTSGTEQWQYTVSDAAGSTASRAYRLTVRKADSVALFHNYTTLLRPVPQGGRPSDTLRARRNAAQVFLNLRSGLLLPRYSVINQQGTVQANQQLIDVVCLARGNAITLENPTWTPALPGAPTRRTYLLRTSLTAAQFGSAVTTASFAAAFAAGQPFLPDSLTTTPLVKGSVLAFKTAEGDVGLLQVNDLTTGTAPLLSCSIKVQKR